MNTAQNLQIETLDLVPLSRWNDYYPYPTIGALRQLVFHNEDDFRKRVTRTIGKRMYIKVSAFKEWVESTQEGKV